MRTRRVKREDKKAPSVHILTALRVHSESSLHHFANFPNNRSRSTMGLFVEQDIGALNHIRSMGEADCHAVVSYCTRLANAMVDMNRHSGL